MSETRHRPALGSATTGEKPTNAIPLPASVPPAVKTDIRLYLFYFFLLLGCVCDVLLLTFPYHSSIRLFSRYALGVFFCVASIPHFTSPHVYLPIMPPFLPFPLFLIRLSGLGEGLLGLLCFAPQPWLQGVATWGLVALLLAVFPANIWGAVSKKAQKRSGIPASFAWARLPMQGVFLLWAWLLNDRSVQDTLLIAIHEAGKWVK